MPEQQTRASAGAGRRRQRTTSRRADRRRRAGPGGDGVRAASPACRGSSAARSSWRCSSAASCCSRPVARAGAAVPSGSAPASPGLGVAAARPARPAPRAADRRGRTVPDQPAAGAPGRRDADRDADHAEGRRSRSRSRPTCRRSRPATSSRWRRAASTTARSSTGRRRSRTARRSSSRAAIPTGTGTRRPRLHDQGRAGHDTVQARHGRDGPARRPEQRRLAVLHRPRRQGRRHPRASANTYQIIGNVTSGMDVADAIYAASGGVELPANPVPITTATVANP